METDKDFENFFKENYSRFYYFALQMVDDEEVCRDIVGDAFEQAWLASLQSRKTSLHGYMFSIVRNKCVDYVRYQSAKTRYADFYLAMYSESTDDEEEYLETERRITLIQEKMTELTPKTRQILEMCYFLKKTYQQTADELGISVSAVRKHIVNALKAFREDIPKKSK